MSKSRSPRYPSMSLSESISKVRQLYEQENLVPAPREVIAEAIGYKGITGPSTRALSSLAQYGLIVKSGEDYRVSERAMKILFPQDTQEKIEALESASVSPPLFFDLQEHFDKRVPSEQNLKIYLARNNFLKSAINSACSSYLETMQYLIDQKRELGYERAEESHETELKTDNETKKTEETHAEKSLNGQPVTGESVYLQGQLDKDAFYKLIVKGDFTTNHLTKLIYLLIVQGELQKQELSYLKELIELHEKMAQQFGSSPEQNTQTGNAPSEGE